jgi:hypothetical protein
VNDHNCHWRARWEWLDNAYNAGALLFDKSMNVRPEMSLLEAIDRIMRQNTPPENVATSALASSGEGADATVSRSRKVVSSPPHSKRLRSRLGPIPEGLSLGDSYLSGVRDTKSAPNHGENMAAIVKVGETLKLQMSKWGTTTVETVLPACDNKTNGHWYCETHRTHLANGFAKDSHLGPRCRMAWFCNEHGMEQP